MKKTAFLKKLSAIILSVVMILSVLGGTISVSADDAETKTDILLNNTSGRVYGVPFELTQAQEYTPDYDTLQYTALVDLNNSWYRYGTDFSGDNIFEDPSLTKVTDGNSDETVALSDASDNTKEDGKLVIEKYRAAIAYDLGGIYNLDTFTLQLDAEKTYIVRNFSVYAGNTLDGTIFNNRIAVGGSNSVVDNITVEAQATAVKYIVIVFDHITASNQTMVNTYGTYVHLKQINLYGTKATDVLLGNTTGRVYGVPYELSQDQEYTPDYSSLEYSELVDMNGYWNRYGTDISLNGPTSDTNDPSLVNLTDGDSDELVFLRAASDDKIAATGKYLVETHRSAIVYDLGSYYNLDALRLELDGSATSNILHNFSVYAGKTLDGSVFENRIAVGGTNSATTTEISVDANTEMVKYVVIVFDHVTTYYNNTVNRYGYKINLKQINLYGTKATDILLGNTSGRVYGVPFALTQAQEYTPDYDTLQYTALVDLNNSWYRYGTDFSGDNIFEDPSLAKVTDGNSDETVVLSDASDNTKEDGKLVIEKYRAAIAYDLGGIYNLDTLTLQLDAEKASIVRNFSVYAGNKLDGTIFNNRIAVGGANAVVDNITVDAKATSAKYIVIVFDHITASNQTMVNTYSSYVYLKQINLYGTKATDVLLGNTTGRVYGVPYELSQGQTYTPDYNTLKYNELVDMNAYWYRYGTDIASNGPDSDMDDPSLAYLTDGNSDEVVHLRDSSDTPKEDTGKRVIESYRAAIAYDLGSMYSLDTLVLTLDSSQAKILRNFSVYAGDTLDGTIFNNRVAVGGANAVVDSITVDAKAASARYVVIVFDHVTNSYDAIVNTYGYDVFLKEIKLYGGEPKEITEPVEDVYGDIDVNGKVDVMDYIILSKALVSEIELSSDVADLNADGNINSHDLVIVKKILLGFDVEPPVVEDVADPDLNDQGTDGTDAF